MLKHKNYSSRILVSDILLGLLVFVRAMFMVLMTRGFANFPIHLVEVAKKNITSDTSLVLLYAEDQKSKL